MIYQRFYAAPFALDGELLGIGSWPVTALSPRWLAFSRDILSCGGDTFNRLLPAPFERVHLRFTSVQGAALATFSLGALPVASSAFLRGDNVATEQQVLRMFVQSARRSEVVRRAQTTAEPFEQAFNILERPLHVVIAWGTGQEDDAGIIPALGAHFAGAFLYGQNAS